MKKFYIAVLVALAFVSGSLLPKPNGQECKAETNTLKKNQAYKAGDYVIYYRTYKGKGGKVFEKIDIKGKHVLIGGVYKKGATIEESR